ncbi:MAG: hypothetical protein DMF58_21255, partial [Acidobacteria bacterium]
FSNIPVEEMLSKAYARRRAELIDPQRAAESVDAGQLPTHGGDTTYLCAVDAAGNVVSLIQSNFANFGAAGSSRSIGHTQTPSSRTSGRCRP